MCETNFSYFLNYTGFKFFSTVSPYGKERCFQGYNASVVGCVAVVVTVVTEVRERVCESIPFSYVSEKHYFFGRLHTQYDMNCFGKKLQNYLNKT